MERLQYYLNYILGSSCESESGTIFFTVLSITDKKPINNDHFPYGIPVDLAEFIHLNCYCSYCKQPIDKDLSACKCGNALKENSHLMVRINEDGYQVYNNPIYKLFDLILNREKRRIYSRQRYERYKPILKEAGKHSSKEVTSLYEIQNHMCYYCGKRLNTMGKHKFHKDHYNPISDFGSNEITNIVLTCPKCNKDKSNCDGDKYKRIISKLLSDEQKKIVRKIRRDVGKFWKKYD